MIPPASSRAPRVVGWALSLLLSLGTLHGQELPPRQDALPSVAWPPAQTDEALARAARDAAGKAAAATYCQVCHLLPDPNLVDQRTWWEQILPRMGARLGLPAVTANDPEAELSKASGVFPSAPLLSMEQFYEIAGHYRHSAPEVSRPQGTRAEIKIGLKQFDTERPRFRSNPPATSMVKIHESTRSIYVGDDAAKALFVLDATGRPLSTLPVANTPVAWLETAVGGLVTCIGSFQPSERRLGEVFEVARTGDDLRRGTTLLRELPRTVDLAQADLNGDGRLDLIPCLFGNLTGRFSWYENKGDGQYAEDELLSYPGPIRCVVHDFNGDQAPDLAVLVAQAIEGLYIFYNDGRGQFPRRQMVFQKPPVYGHVYFELVDFNGDGRQDFLVCNGDNGEYTSPPKNYHGIRLYEDRGAQGGTNRYEETWFYPMNGAFKAVARDFDADGDLDIAAISWFPDYEKSPRESFVYLENQGGLKFEASTFRECVAGRWLVMDVGDLDGDSDLDIVLGSYIYGPSPAPGFLMETWKSRGPSVQILLNKLKAPAGP